MCTVIHDVRVLVSSRENPEQMSSFCSILLFCGASAPSVCRSTTSFDKTMIWILNSFFQFFSQNFMMKCLSSSFVSLPLLLLLQLLLLVTISFAFLSTNVLPTLEVSQHAEKKCQSNAKGRQQQTLVVSSWSKIAEFDVSSSSFRLIDTRDAASNGRNPTCAGQEENYNLVSPREWLEYCEAGQQRDERSNLEKMPSGGAYTVLRCDFLLDQEIWRIWGRDFHFHRLEESFRSLVSRQDEDDSKTENERLALESSREVMSLLLEEAKTTILSTIAQQKTKDSSRIVIMLTLLWDLEHAVNDSDDGIPIRVRGHAFSTMQASQLHHNGDSDGNGDIVAVPNPNTPIQTVIGHLPADILEILANQKRFTNSGSLPTRYQNLPRAKLSSWCRRRRLLEEMFKTKDVGDVLLTKPCETSLSSETAEAAEAVSKSLMPPAIELLEGLTSNLFVVYPGKIIRTAPSKHVLGGYVRHRVIECAENCGYTVEFGSIPVEDSSLWEEVFVTSSIRLIIPVERIFLPSANTDDNDRLFELKTLWAQEQSSNEEGKDGFRIAPTASDILYTELVKHAT